MKHMKKSILSVVATGALLLNLATPALAASTITISGNGSDSSNAVNTTTSNTTTVTQHNTATVANTVTASGNTGNNNANENTGGSTAVMTGGATTKVSIDNTLNKNVASVPTASADPVNLNVMNNGSDSLNNIINSQTGNTVVEQDNVANVANTVNANAKTGSNNTNKNTGGDVSVMTGNADTLVGISTSANSNTAAVGNGSSDNAAIGGNVAANVNGNGADSANGVAMELNNGATIYQTNAAEVANNVTSKADSGKNKANENTNGDVQVLTGDASNITGVNNDLNFNAASLNNLMAMNLTANVTNNGADSYNTMDFGFSSDKNVTQMNDASVANTLDSKSNTGKNDANENTGGDVGIGTGNAQTLAGINNLLNFNSADVGNGSMDIMALIDSNGADSSNALDSTSSLDKLTYQTNDGSLANTLTDPSAKTGKNNANENTGTMSDNQVLTGDSLTSSNITNTSNMNQEGPALLMPTLGNMNVQVTWNWNQFFSMFHW
jgi:hypothetical protein